MSEILGPEQQRRVAIFEEYDVQAKPLRDARNSAISAHELEWREKSIQFMSGQEQMRLTSARAYEAKGLVPGAAYAATAFDLAKEFEAHMIEKDQSARKLDQSLGKPKPWRDHLNELDKSSPGDPVVAALIKEASSCDHELAVAGFAKTPPPERLLSALSMTQDEDGATAFRRGTSLVFRDVGHRLDVQKTDQRDIAAALKVAAQKFDTDKGIQLTGDTQFKTTAAEIAGQMGIKLRNTEPEVLHAWERGRKQSAELLPSRAPAVGQGIEGEVRTPGIDRVRGDQLLHVDPDAALRAGALLRAAGVEFVAVGNDKDPARMMMASALMVKLPEGRTEAALAAWRGLPREASELLARADLSKSDGGLNAQDKQIAVLVDRQLVDEDGRLKPAGIDVVLVRDDHIVRSRSDPLTQVIGGTGGLKTSAEFVREAAGELKTQTGLVREASERAVQKTEAAELPQEREPEQQRDDTKREEEREPGAVQQLRKRARSREQDVGLGL